MINLAPIPARIQQRLFEKQQAMGKPVKYPGQSSDTLTFDDMASRSTYIRMISGHTNAVVLQGGRLEVPDSPDEQPVMKGGFDHIYGPKTYKVGGLNQSQADANLNEALRGDKIGLPLPDGIKGQEAIAGKKKTLPNDSKMPMPGITSIDVSFKGGLKTLREATIKWKCFSWSELDELMPHFLSHGKTVLLEWGWVYPNQGIKPTAFLETDDAGNRFIKVDAFKSPVDTVIQRKGDLDVMTGIIKNFSFTTDADGAFDCETKITSVGISMINNTLPPASVLDPGQTFNLDLRENTVELAGKLRDATGDQTAIDTGFWDVSNYDASATQEGKDRIIDLNSTVTLKAVISNLDRYVARQLSTVWETHTVLGRDSDIVVMPEKFIGVGNNNQNAYRYGGINDAWVRWGWFEDNILSKFLSLTTEDGKIITEFRSIENILTQNGEATGQYESVRIRNHEYLETVNIGSYILPGQIYPQETWNEKTNLKESETKLEQQLKEEPAENITKDEPTSKGNPTVPFDSQPLSGWLRTAEILGLYERNGLFQNSEIDTNMLASTVDVNVLRAIIEHDDLSSTDLDLVKTRLAAVQSAQRIADEANRPLNMGIVNTEADRLQPIRVEVELPGDTKLVQKLAKLVNDVDNFPSFATETNTISKGASEDYTGTLEQNLKLFKVRPELKGQSKDVRKQAYSEEFGKDDASEVAKPGKYGYLRNMLINVKTIKQAFGVDEEVTTEPINIIEALEGMFASINGEFNFWNFKIETDSREDYRAKIIDEAITDFNFEQTTPQQMSRFESGQVKVNDEGKAGVFFFPTWRTDSIVKSQDVTAKIPDAMALATMYGGNMNQSKDFMNPGNQFGEAAGVIVGGLYNSQQDVDKKGLDIAYRNQATRGIGNDTGDANDPLTKSGGGDIFGNLSTKDLEERYETRVQDILNNVTTLAEEKAAQKARLMFDDSVPPPLARQMDRVQLHALLVGETEIEGYESKEKRNELKTLYGSVYESDGKMKKRFLQTISYLTTNHGKYKNSTQSILIPLDFSCTVDGTGGIYPGNSFHSYYLPSRYRNDTVFQATNVNHVVNSSGWDTSITGMMRSSKSRIFKGYKTIDELTKGQLENLDKRMVARTKAAKKNKEKQDEIRNDAFAKRSQVGMGSGRML